MFVQRVWEESESQTEEELSSEQDEVTRPQLSTVELHVPVCADVALGKSS